MFDQEDDYLYMHNCCTSFACRGGLTAYSHQPNYVTYPDSVAPKTLYGDAQPYHAFQTLLIIVKKTLYMQTKNVKEDTKLIFTICNTFYVLLLINQQMFTPENIGQLGFGFFFSPQ